MKRIVFTALMLSLGYLPAYGQLVTITPAPGPTGATGSAGTNGSNGTNGSAGTNGNSVLNGIGAPSAGTGNNGDYYIDTSAKVIYGPKASGAWGAGTSLVGPGGVAGVNAFGVPNARSISPAAALQATDPTKPSVVTVSLTSTANISLSGGTTNTAGVYIGAASSVATTGGVKVCDYTNSNTGALTIGLNLSTIATTPCTFSLPTGYYFAFRVSAGTVTASSATDSSVG